MPSLKLKQIAYGGGLSNILGGEERGRSEWEKEQRGKIRVINMGIDCAKPKRNNKSRVATTFEACEV